MYEIIIYSVDSTEVEVVRGDYADFLHSYYNVENRGVRGAECWNDNNILIGRLGDTSYEGRILG